MKEIPTWLSLLISTIPTLLSFVLTKPIIEEARIGRLKKSLLNHFRLKISIEVANVLPEKEMGTEKDDYIAICKNSLNEYFSANSFFLIDFLYCENLFKSYIKWLRCFKYGIIIIPTITILSIIVLKIVYHKNVSIVIPLITVVLIILLWILMEYRKDKCNDLCSKYEITDDK